MNEDGVVGPGAKFQVMYVFVWQADCGQRAGGMYGNVIHRQLLFLALQKPVCLSPLAATAASGERAVEELNLLAS